MPTKEQIKALIKFDIHCQDSNPVIDKKLSNIYRFAEGNENGWKGIAEHSSASFWEAFGLIE